MNTQIEFQVNSVRITDSQRYRCYVTDGRQSNMSESFVRVLPHGTYSYERLSLSLREPRGIDGHVGAADVALGGPFSPNKWHFGPEITDHSVSN